MTRNILYFFTAIYMLLAGGITDASAVPAYPKPITYTQSDGTRITIRIIGDEYHHYVLSQEGYTLIGGADKDYYYARLAASGRLEATSVKAKPYGQLTTAEKSIVSTLNKGIKPAVASQLQRPTTIAQVPPMLMSSVGELTPPGRITNGQTLGDLPSLIILAEFSDIKFEVSSPREAFGAMLTQQGYSLNGSTGSALDYYRDNSNGKFTPQFKVIGPFTSTKSSSYFGQGDGAAKVYELVAEVCRMADAEIDFRQYADNGVIRDIFIFYAGHNQAEGAAGTIWPHRSDVSVDLNVVLDGVQLAGYACSSEFSGSSGQRMASIGTFCHEFGHVLGWPDFYDTDYERSGGEAPALEYYSLMSMGSYNNNSRTPPALNILERWMVGWATPEEINDAIEYELSPVTDDKGLMISTNTNNDYFLAEYRGAGKTIWDNPQYLNNMSGLMVYHVDYTTPYQRRWTLRSNSVNAFPEHECMKLVRSDPDTYFDAGSTFFPGNKGVSSLTPSSNRNYVAWSGTEPTLHFSNIKLVNGALLMDVKQIGGPALGFEAQTFQYDALLSWKDKTATSWKVSWKEKFGTEELGSATLETPKLHIGGLLPAATYEITISATSNTGEEWEQTHTFSTTIRSSNASHIGFSDTYFGPEEPILMTLLDYKGNLKNIEWYIDNQKSDTNYLLLPPGEHIIMAVIQTNDGSKEYIVKYITVKQQ